MALLKNPDEKSFPQNIILRIISVICFVLFLNLFFFHSFGSAAFSLVSLGFFAFLLSVFANSAFVKSSRKSLAGFVLAIFGLSLVPIFRTNPITVIVTTISLLSALALFIYCASSALPFVRSLMELVLSFSYLAKSYAVSALRLVGELFSNDAVILKIFSPKKYRRIKTLVPWILGFAVGLPVVVILVSMLSSADPIFSSYVGQLTAIFTNMFKGEFWKTVFNRLTLSAIFLILLSPFILLERKKIFRSPLEFLSRFSLLPQMTIVMVLVAVTLAGFLMIQWQYVFAHVPFETDLSKFGVATYSEYVKKGFGELLMVSLVVYSLIWSGLIVLRVNKMRKNEVFVTLQLIVLLEFAVFLMSIFRRIMLYQQYHGWSLGRIYGGFLLVWILIMAITLVCRHLVQKRWVVVEVVMTALLIGILGGFNAENFIAVNHPPTVNRRIDYVYLSRMSSDGYIGWQKAYEFARSILLSKGTSTKQVINRDERRDIAYAGIIIHELTENYQNHLDWYGTDSEKKEYYQKVFEFLKEENTNTLKYFQPQVASVAAISNVQVSKPTVVPSPFINTSYIFQQALSEKPVIDAALEKIQQNELDVKELHSIYIDSWSNYILFDPTREAVQFYRLFVPESQYFQKVAGKQKIGLLDKLFTWNYSSARVYAVIRGTIGVDSLLDLQKRFMIFYRKISSQERGEIEYDTDISFDTPFLAPL